MDLYQILCVYVIVISLVFCGNPNSGDRCAFDIFWLVLGFFSSYWVDLCSLDWRVFALSYFILFYHDWLLSLEGLLQSEGKGKWRGNEFGGEGRCERTTRKSWGNGSEQYSILKEYILSFKK